MFLSMLKKNTKDANKIAQKRNSDDKFKLAQSEQLLLQLKKIRQYQILNSPSADVRVSKLMIIAIMGLNKVKIVELLNK